MVPLTSRQLERLDTVIGKLNRLVGSSDDMLVRDRLMVALRIVVDLRTDCTRKKTGENDARFHVRLHQAQR